MSINFDYLLQGSIVFDSLLEKWFPRLLLSASFTGDVQERCDKYVELCDSDFVDFFSQVHGLVYKVYVDESRENKNNIQRGKPLYKEYKKWSADKDVDEDRLFRFFLVASSSHLLNGAEYNIKAGLPNGCRYFCEFVSKMLFIKLYPYVGSFYSYSIHELLRRAGKDRAKTENYNISYNLCDDFLVTSNWGAFISGIRRLLPKDAEYSGDISFTSSWNVIRIKVPKLSFDSPTFDKIAYNNFGKLCATNVKVGWLPIPEGTEFYEAKSWFSSCGFDVKIEDGGFVLTYTGCGIPEVHSVPTGTPLASGQWFLRKSGGSPYYVLGVFSDVMFRERMIALRNSSGDIFCPLESDFLKDFIPAPL